SAIELANLRAAQASVMNDECNIKTIVIGKGAMGGEAETPTDHNAIECGVAFLDAGGDGRMPVDAYTGVEYDAIIRLPLALGFAIDIQTVFVIVDKGGTAVGKTFRPIASPEISFSAQNIKLKEVTN
ncbi:unnamed protein product, partial [marine sediment metagenome]